MKIIITAPKRYGLFGWFGMITDLQIAMREAVSQYRKTGKPVSVVYNGYHDVKIEVKNDGKD